MPRLKASGIVKYIEIVSIDHAEFNKVVSSLFDNCFKLGKMKKNKTKKNIAVYINKELYGVWAVCSYPPHSVDFPLKIVWFPSRKS